MSSNLQLCEKHQTHRRLIYDCEVVKYPDGMPRIITCSNDQTLKVYNYTTREFEYEVTHPCSLYNIRSIDENTILTTDFYGEIIFWNLPDLKATRSFRIFSKNTIIWDVLLLPTDHIMACTSNGSSKGQVRVCDYGTKNCPVKSLVHRNEGIGVLCRLKRTKNVVLFGGGDLRRYGGRNFGIYQLTFDKIDENDFFDDHQDAYEYENDTNICWMGTKQRAPKLELFGSQEHENRVTSIISFICPWNGQEKVISGSSDQRIVVWYSDGTVVSVINGCDERISVFFPLSSEVVLIGGAIQTYRGKRIDFEGEGSIYSLDLKRNKIKKIWSDDQEHCEVVWGMKWLEEDDDVHKEEEINKKQQKQQNEDETTRKSQYLLEPKRLQKKIVVVSNDGRTRVLKMNAECKMLMRRDESIQDEKERIRFLEQEDYFNVSIGLRCFYGWNRVSVMGLLLV